MINYDEAFGLDVVEAMESGIQVIAMNRVSMPELILDGETKFWSTVLMNCRGCAEGCFHIPQKM